MRQYLNLLQHVLENGTMKTDRTGTGTLSVFGAQMRFDLSKGFPLVTTKKVHMKSIVHELLWFLRGETNVAYLQENGVKIWDEWALKEDEFIEKPLSDRDRFLKLVFSKKLTIQQTLGIVSNLDDPADAQYGHTKMDELGIPRTEKVILRKKGDLGPIYGYQWRNWPTPSGESIDQIRQVIQQIKTTPDSRRMIVSAWNVAQIDEMALPPCHTLFQFYVADGKLSCQLYQRSADLFLGVPFNIASYSLLVHMIAQVCDLQVGEFIWTGGDCHIYLNHQDQVRQQLEREPKELPGLLLNPEVRDIFAFQYADVDLINYDPHPAIKGEVAV